MVWAMLCVGLASCGGGATLEAEDCAADHPDWGQGGDLMLPGTDCLSCHREGGSAAASPLTVAGTVFASAQCPDPAEGAVVHVRDADGTELALPTNEVGNFFTAEPLHMPLTVWIARGDGVLDKPMGAVSGDCNGCHQPDGAGYVRAPPASE
jgi:hypothetical protein